MGKNNNRGNNRNNAQRTPRYTGKNVDSMGDAGRMGWLAMKYFRDMAHGKFNWGQSITSFQNTEFVNAAITEVQQKLWELQVIATSLSYTYGASTDINIANLMMRYNKAIDGWSFVLNMLFNIHNSGDYSFINALINRLPDYKNELNY